MGYVISATGEDDRLLFTQRLSSSNYFFVYAAGENNVVGLIQPTPDITYTLEAYITYDDVIDTMLDDIM